ncbi:SIMPL domain-containing protein [Paenibacillus alkaliterrae]|uniref:SIMPL domain-containing protein n=1 Tax=Paenibacillus alkaliterrae TaxID=320909 RepID=UPI001F3C3317|nr:SIMPL domain-containing protein [Paenibacillus alkaliterrae]MCF2937209.1 SIMPL domain-containing protein [Paenibacillus alkaliterrae]
MYSHSYGNSPSNQSKCPFTIEVLGEGTLAAPPDRAVAVLGAITEGQVLQTVQSENAQIVTNIIEALLELNIPKDKIQTDDFRIEAQYEYIDGQQVFRGYKVTHLLQITIDRIEDIGIVIDTAVSNGANTVAGIQFTMAQPAIYENEVLALAIQNARQKAETIAAALQVNLAAVPSQVQELSRSAEPIPFTASLHMQSAATPVEPGQLTLTATVRVWYLFG